MQSIPGWVYLLIGAVISVASYLINYEKMILFFYTGFVFIGVGVAKIGLGKIFPELREKALSPQYAMQGQRPMHRPSALHRMETHMHQAQQQHPVQQQVPTSNLVCSSCGARLHSSFSYCPRCGQKLR